jgi:hypothetical protein
MIEVTEKAEPEIKYPVGRRWKGWDEMVVIFWSETHGTVIYSETSKKKPLGFTDKNWVSCINYSLWEPVSLEITGERIVLGGSMPAKEQLAYPVAKKRKDDGLIVILTTDQNGVVADLGKRTKDSMEVMGSTGYWGEARDPKNINWEPVDVHICG